MQNLKVLILKKGEEDIVPFIEKAKAHIIVIVDEKGNYRIVKNRYGKPSQSGNIKDGSLEFQLPPYLSSEPPEHYDITEFVDYLRVENQKVKDSIKRKSYISYIVHLLSLVCFMSSLILTLDGKYPWPNFVSNVLFLGIVNLYITRRNKI